MVSSNNGMHTVCFPCTLFFFFLTSHSFMYIRKNFSCQDTYVCLVFFSDGCIVPMVLLYAIVSLVIPMWVDGSLFSAFYIT